MLGRLAQMLQRRGELRSNSFILFDTMRVRAVNKNTGTSPAKLFQSLTSYLTVSPPRPLCPRHSHGFYPSHPPAISEVESLGNPVSKNVCVSQSGWNTIGEIDEIGIGPCQ